MGTPREKQPSAKIQWHPAFCAAAELELRSIRAISNLNVSTI